MLSPHVKLAFSCCRPDPLREPDLKAVCLEDDRAVLLARIDFVCEFLAALTKSRVQELRRETHFDKLRLSHYRLREYHVAHLLLWSPARQPAGRDSEGVIPMLR